MTSPAAVSPTRQAPPRWVRRYVAVFLVAFTVCGVFGVEAWPLTGWRLFADARERIQPGLQATAVDAAGRERPIDFRGLPAGYQGNVQVLRGFPSLGPEERLAVCAAWAAALRERGAEVAAIRVYATRTDVGDRRGPRGAPPERTLRYTCQGGQVQEAAALTSSGRPDHAACQHVGPPARTLARSRAAQPALSTGPPTLGPEGPLRVRLARPGMVAGRPACPPAASAGVGRAGGAGAEVARGRCGVHGPGVDADGRDGPERRAQRRAASSVLPTGVRVGLEEAA